MKLGAQPLLSNTETPASLNLGSDADIKESEDRTSEFSDHVVGNTADASDLFLGAIGQSSQKDCRLYGSVELNLVGGLTKIEVEPSVVDQFSENRTTRKKQLSEQLICSDTFSQLLVHGHPNGVLKTVMVEESSRSESNPKKFDVHNSEPIEILQYKQHPRANFSNQTKLAEPNLGIQEIFDGKPLDRVRHFEVADEVIPRSGESLNRDVAFETSARPTAHLSSNLTLQAEHNFLQNSFAQSGPPQPRIMHSMAGSDAWLTEVGNELARFKEADRVLIIQLRPSNLGKLRVEIDTQHDYRNVSLATENEEAKSVLISVQTKLEQELRTLGSKSIRVHIDVEQNNQSASDQFQFRSDPHSRRKNLGNLEAAPSLPEHVACNQPAVTWRYA